MHYTVRIFNIQHSPSRNLNKRPPWLTLPKASLKAIWKSASSPPWSNSNWPAQTMSRRASHPLNKTCSWGYSRIFAMSCNDPEYPTSHKVYSWISINIRKMNLLWRIFLNIWLWILDFPDILEHSYFEYSYLNIEEYSENPYSILFQYFTINISLYSLYPLCIPDSILLLNVRLITIPLVYSLCFKNDLTHYMWTVEF